MDIKPIEEKLRELILSNYKSIRDFSIKIDVPYTTVDTILRRGVDKANINNIIKICKELNIDTEALGEGKIETKHDKEIKTIAAHKDGIEWTEEELKDIEEFKKYVLSKRKK